MRTRLPGTRCPGSSGGAGRSGQAPSPQPALLRQPERCTRRPGPAGWRARSPAPAPPAQPSLLNPPRPTRSRPPTPAGRQVLTRPSLLHCAAPADGTARAASAAARKVRAAARRDMPSPVGARRHAVSGAERRMKARHAAEAAVEADVGHRRRGGAQQPGSVAGPQLDDIAVRSNADHVTKHVHETGPAQASRLRLRHQVQARIPVAGVGLCPQPARNRPGPLPRPPPRPHAAPRAGPPRQLPGGARQRRYTHRARPGRHPGCRPRPRRRRPAGLHRPPHAQRPCDPRPRQRHHHRRPPRPRSGLEAAR